MDLRKRKRTTASTQPCKNPRRVSQGDGLAANGCKWADLPQDMHNLILAHVSLAELARLATLSKGMQAAYENRLKERQSCIQERLAEGWPAEVTQGLPKEDIAVPRDLVVSPPIPERLQCSLHLNTGRHSVQTADPAPQLGVYRGFCLRGKPDGRGDWVAEPGYSYAGDWREGKPHGDGKCLSPGIISWGEHRDGNHHGRTIICQSDGTLLFAGICEMGEYRSGMATDENGAIWRGHFLRNSLHGRGLHRTAYGDKYVGKWRHGILEGWGVHVKASGDMYIGEFEGGWYHGLGKYTYAATGATRVCQWSQGDPLEFRPSSCSAQQPGNGVSKRSKRRR